MKNYVVRKGKHYCWHGQGVHRNAEEIIIDFRIEADSAYHFANPGDYSDVNKIGGITFGLGKVQLSKHGVPMIGSIHENSIRIGMFDDFGRVRIYAYWYNNGKRETMYLDSSDYGMFHTYGIRLNRKNNSIEVFNRLSQQKHTAFYDFTNVPKWGFFCYPYFGGNNKAPVDWKVALGVRILK